MNLICYVCFKFKNKAMTKFTKLFGKHFKIANQISGLNKHIINITLKLMQNPTGFIIKKLKII